MASAKAKAIKEKATVTKKQVAEAIKDSTKFTKSQIVKSKKYVDRRDALNALLDDDKKYTFNQVDDILDQFYKGGNK